VDDALLVRFFERFGDLLRDCERFVHRDRAALQPLREVLAGDEFHRQEVAGRAVGKSCALEAVDSKRARRSGSCASSAGSTLIATSRPSFVSVARYTSPMPPAPIAAVIR
jgi:hypothetical protein